MELQKWLFRLCRRTALHVASSKGHTETAMALVNAGADVHCKTNDGYGSALRKRFVAAAVGYGRDCIARQLRKPSCLRDCGQKGLC